MSWEFRQEDGSLRVPKNWTDSTAVNSALSKLHPDDIKKYDGELKKGDRGTYFELAYLGQLLLRHGDKAMELYPDTKGPDAYVHRGSDLELEVKAHVTTPDDAHYGRICQSIRAKIESQLPDATGHLRLDNIGLSELDDCRVDGIAKAAVGLLGRGTPDAEEGSEWQNVCEGVRYRSDSTLEVYRGQHSWSAQDEARRLDEKLRRNVGRGRKGPQFTGNRPGILAVLFVQDPAMTEFPWLDEVAQSIFGDYPVLTGIYGQGVPTQRPGKLLMRDELIAGEVVSMDSRGLGEFLFAEVGVSGFLDGELQSPGFRRLLKRRKEAGRE